MQTQTIVHTGSHRSKNYGKVSYLATAVRNIILILTTLLSSLLLNRQTDSSGWNTETTQESFYKQPALDLFLSSGFCMSLVVFRASFFFTFLFSRTLGSLCYSFLCYIFILSDSLCSLYFFVFHIPYKQYFPKSLSCFHSWNSAQSLLLTVCSRSWNLFMLLCHHLCFPPSLAYPFLCTWPWFFPHRCGFPSPPFWQLHINHSYIPRKTVFLPSVCLFLLYILYIFISPFLFL